MSSKRSRWSREAARRDDFAVSRAMRPTCTDCGGSHLCWMVPGTALAVLGSDALRRAVVALEVSSADEVDFWCCEDCGDWGALGPGQVLG